MYKIFKYDVVKKTQNDSLRDVVLKCYEGVIYFQSVIRCHGTRVNVT